MQTGQAPCNGQQRGAVRERDRWTNQQTDRQPGRENERPDTFQHLISVEKLRRGKSIAKNPRAVLKMHSSMMQMKSVTVGTTLIPGILKWQSTKIEDPNIPQDSRTAILCTPLY